MPDNNTTGDLTAQTLTTIPNAEVSQLDQWTDKPESHERLAAGEKEKLRTKKAKKEAREKIEAFFRDIDIE
ncbi:hypothetical protein P7C71_g3204, partial [Lecanoromycetidae sp. Uapishka_2]